MKAITVLKNILFGVSAAALSFILSEGASAQTSPVRIHCQADSLKVVEILSRISGKDMSLGQRVVAAAKALEGTPHSQTLEIPLPSTMMVALDSLDNIDYLNSVLALAFAADVSSPGIRDYEKYLQRVSRRRGEGDSFVARLKYGAQWVVDNVYKGNVKDMTDYLTGSGFRTSTFDHYTRNRSAYPALSDSAAYEEQRMIEMGYRGHKVPFMKKQSIRNKEMNNLLQEGDIIMMLSQDTSHDVYDVGFVTFVEGEPRLIHMSPEEGKVELAPYPLARLFKLLNQHFYGYRWLRPTE